ncbi:MAG TPA: VOC family protein [Alphaproteobacteria bacterium]|nr:VOC family protein [Alphaproteobacteria bacterium]
MKPRISVITLGVDDLERAVGFYRDGLGLATKGIVGKEFEHGAVAFFDLGPGLKLALWARDDIAFDTALPRSAPSPTEFTIGHNVIRKEEVDAVMELARAAGARIVRTAQDTFYGGYAGYFQDPDGHLWEIVWNPEFLPDD